MSTPTAAAAADLPDEEDANVKKHIAQKEYMRVKALAKAASGSSTSKTTGSGGDGTSASTRSGLPPGQTLAPSWLVLDIRPSDFKVPADEDTWAIDINHHSQGSTTVLLRDLKARSDVVEFATEFHCVTSWSYPHLAFRGVPLVNVIRDAFPSAITSASSTVTKEDTMNGTSTTSTTSTSIATVDFHTIMQYGLDKYTTSMHLAPSHSSSSSASGSSSSSSGDIHVVDVLSNAYLIWAYKRVGKDEAFQPLGEDHGTVRLFYKYIYGYKSCKWLRRIDLLCDPLHNIRGFWEVKGYHDIGSVHSEDRFEVTSSKGKLTQAIMNPLNGWFSWYAITFPDLFLVAQQVLSGDVFRSLFRPKFYLMAVTFWGCMPLYFGREAVRYAVNKLRPTST